MDDGRESMRKSEKLSQEVHYLIGRRSQAGEEENEG